MPNRLLNRLRRQLKAPPVLSKRKLRTGEARVVRVGHEKLVFRDLYVNLLSMPWLVLLPMVAVFYMLSNVAFAAVFYYYRDGITYVTTFADAFFFSVQTMATIGYGRMAPTTPMTNVLVTFEALWGFSYFAFVTGLMFSKFSKPTAQVLFSNIAVISDFEGKPHLKMRVANKRDNRIVDVTARMFLLRNGTTKEGFVMRRFYDLGIVRDHMPLLRLTWTLLHPIDESSPLHGITAEQMAKTDDEIFVTLIGMDETLAQTIHARHSYFVDEIQHGAYFEDVVKRDDTSVQVDYGKFHSVRKDAPHSWS